MNSQPPNPNTVVIYTDGSCINKTKDKGGFGIVMMWGEHMKEIAGGSYTNTTSSRMEILATIVAMEMIDPKFNIEINSDSQYVVNTINEGWIFTWERNNFFNRTNGDLWKRFLAAYRRFKPSQVKFNWVRGHNGQEYNELADNLAREGANKEIVVVDK